MSEASAAEATDEAALEKKGRSERPAWNDLQGRSTVVGVDDDHSGRHICLSEDESCLAAGQRHLVHVSSANQKCLERIPRTVHP